MVNTSNEDLIQLTLRIPTASIDWLKEIGVKSGLNVNKTLRRIVEDAWTWYGMPPPQVAALKADCQRLGMDPLDPRQYLMHLLTERYAQLGREPQPAKKK